MKNHGKPVIILKGQSSLEFDSSDCAVSDLYLEIDTLRLRVKVLEEALWKLAHWQTHQGADMRQYASQALERAAIGEFDRP